MDDSCNPVCTIRQENKERYLGPDMGFYFKWNIDETGHPAGCPGFKNKMTGEDLEDEEYDDEYYYEDDDEAGLPVKLNIYICTNMMYIRNNIHRLTYFPILSNFQDIPGHVVAEGDYIYFNGPWTSMVKTITMFVGELDKIYDVSSPFS